MNKPKRKKKKDIKDIQWKYYIKKWKIETKMNKINNATSIVVLTIKREI